MSRRFRNFVASVMLAAPAVVAAQTTGSVTIAVGSTPTVKALPGGKLAVPVMLDMSAAAGSNLASLTSGVRWDSGRLQLDSVRAGAFGTLTPNTADVVSGSLWLSLFNPTGTTATASAATMYFSVSPTRGSTRIKIATETAANDAGASLLAMIQNRALDVCVVPFGKWGDVNADSVVNILDAQQVSRLAVGLSVANPDLMTNSGDINADDAVNILDAQQMARAAIGLTTTAPRLGGTVGVIPPVATVSLEGAPQVAVGGTLALSPTPKDSTGASLGGCVPTTWTSSDPNIALVDATGLVRGISAGTATITMTVAGRSASTNVVVGGGVVAQGLVVHVTSPVPVKKFFVWAGIIGSDGTGVAVQWASNSRTAAIPIALPVGSQYTVRVAAIDSLSTDTLSPRVVATGSTGGTVLAGALTDVATTLTVPSITVLSASATTINAGIPAPISYRINDASKLFTDQTTTAFCSRVRYRANSKWVTDEIVPDTLTTINANNVCDLNSTDQTDWSTTLPVVSSTGRQYWQVMQQAFVPGTNIKPTLFGPSLSKGDTLASIAVTAPAQGIKIDFTAPAAGTRYVAQISSGPLTFSIFKALDTTSVATGSITIPTPVGTGFTVRLMAIDANDPLKSRMVSGMVSTGVNVAASTITTVAMTLQPFTWNYSATSASVTAGDRPTIGWTFTDPTGGLVGSFNHNITYSSTRFTTDINATGATIASAPPTNLGNNQWRYSRQLPAQTTSGSLFYQVSDAFSAISGDGLIPLRVVDPFLAGGDTLRRIAVTDVTEGITVNITSPLAASRWIVVVDSGSFTQRTSWIRLAPQAQSGTVSVPVPVGTGYRVRVLAVDARAKNPEGAAQVNAGIRLSGVNVTAGAVTTVTAALQPITATYTTPTTATAGTPIVATMVLNDPSEYMDNRSNGFTTANVQSYTTPIANDGDGSTTSASLNTTSVRSGITTTSTGTIWTPADTGKLYSQGVFFGGNLLGQGAGVSPMFFAPSLQLGQAMNVITVTAGAQVIRATVNTPVPASRYLAVVDSGGLPSPVSRVITVPMGNTATIDVPVPAGTGYRLRVAAIDTTRQNGTRMVAGNVLSGLTVTSGNPTGVSFSLIRPSITATTTSPQTVGDKPVFRWNIFDPSEMISNPGTQSCLYQTTTTFTKDFGSAASCVTNTATGAHNYLGSVTLSTAPIAPVTYSYQNAFSTCFGNAPAQNCVAYGEPMVTAGDTLRKLVMALPTQGITLNVTNPRGATQYFILVDSGGLASPINFARTVPSTRSTQLVLPLPTGVGYRVRVLVVDSLSSAPTTAPVINSGARISGVTVTANALTTVTANTTPLVATLTAPSTVSAAQAIQVSLVFNDPSETIAPTTTCPSAIVGSTPWTADGAGTPISLCKVITHPSNAQMTALDTLAAPLTPGTLYLQSRIGVASFSAGGNNVSPQFFGPSLTKKETLQSLTVTSIGSGITLSITSPAAKRYVAVVDSGGLPKPIVSVLDGTAMTSGTLTIPTPSGSGFRVRVAAVDSVPGFSMFTSGLVASGSVSGVAVTGSLTAVSIAATAVTGVSSSALFTATNVAAPVSLLVTDPGKMFSSSSSCGTLRSATTAFTAVSTTSNTCLGQSNVAANQWRWSSTAVSSSTAATIYTAWAVFTSQRSTLGDLNMYVFTPAFYRGAVRDSLNYVVPTQIAVNAGNAQTAIVSTAVSVKPSVIVKDALNRPVAGTTVTFVVATGGGTLTGATAVSDANGIATVGNWTLGAVAGSNSITATVSGLTGSPLTFTATGTATAATQIAANSATTQSAQVGAAVPAMPSVLVKDANNNPVSGVSVAFQASGVASSLINGTAGQVNLTTNASGIASLSTWTLGSTAGSYLVTATVVGLTGSPVNFNVTGTAGAASKLVIKTNADGAAVGAAFTTQPSVAVTDAAGNTITTDNSSVVTMTTSAGFTVGTVSKTVVNGIATFTNAGLAGTSGSVPILTFASGALTSATSTVNLVAGSAKSLNLNTQPAGAASGSAFTTQPVLFVKDTLGNTRTQDNTTVVTMTVDLNGAVVGNASATAVNGVVTFTNVGIMGTAGTLYTLTFSSAGLQATTKTITPTAGTATQLVLTGSAIGATSGAAFTTQPVIAIRDGFGNTRTSDNSTVVTMSVSAGATVVGAATATAVGGVATFSTTGISGTAGTTYTLTFASSGLTSATQNVTPTTGAATQIAINAGDGQSGTVGTALPNNPSVIVKDAAGNPVSGVTVTFAIVNGTAATLTGASATTNASGIATVGSWTLGTSAGASNQVMSATAAGLTGSPLNFTASAVAGAATNLALNSNANGIVVGAAFTNQPSILIRDQYGNRVTTDNSTVVTVALSGGAATLSGTLTATASSGIATFSNVAITGTAGTTYTLIYSKSGLTSTSEGVTPTVGAATQLSISTQAAGAVGGGGSFATQPVVTVKDAGGNVVTTATGSVTMSVSSPATTFGSTSATLSSGVATFSGAGISGATGNYTLTFSKAGLTSATQSIPVVGAATALAITTNAAGSKSGSAFTTQPVIRVVDAAGNTVTTSTASVTIASSGDGTIFGPTTATAVGGVATFSTSGITGTADNNYTVTYSSAGLTSVTQSLAVTHGTATNFLVFTQAAGSSSGFNFTTQPVIRIRDSAGNIVLSDNTTQITVTVSSGATVTGTATATAVNGVVTFTNLGLTGALGTYTLSYDSNISLGGTRTQTINIVALF